VSIKAGDRVQTIEGKEGKVEMLSDDGNMAYVQLDENSETGDFSLYEIERLAKIDGETVLPTTQ
jgi:preprotein translocase subunit YajC